MDGRRRLAEPVARIERSEIRERRRELSRTSLGSIPATVLHRLAPLFLRRGAGAVACLLLLAATLVYGTLRGGHTSAVVEAMQDMRDGIANAAGFRIAAVALAGNRQLAREEVLAIAGVTPKTSLLFFDVEAARQRLRANPWIADASVLKLYPHRLQIAIVERQPFALWQFEGQLSVIAEDGTVLDSYAVRRLTALPFVVGSGAHREARTFLAKLDAHPQIKDQVRAAILVAERRWNLRLKNGIDVRLPEDGVEQALQRLAELDAEKQILSRDILVVDLRVPDRIAVRLSSDAAKAREGGRKAGEKIRQRNM